MNYKRELIADIAAQLKSYGYTVYLSKDREYGFYTDGQRVVSFGGPWRLCVSYTGCYNSKHCGTGWQLDGGKDIGTIDAETAKRFITAHAPSWATNGEAVTYTTPEQHLKTYGNSSGYEEYT